MAGNLTAMMASIFSGGVTPDPYFEYTTLLLPGNGTNGANNNTFLDGSTNNFTITRNGNTTQGTFSPFSQTGWGNYFDGSNDNVSTSSSTDLAAGSSAFTVEAWIFTADTSFMICASQTVGGLGFGYNIDNGTQGLWIGRVGQGPDATSGVQLTYNQWNHIAVTRDASNNVKFFVNGTQVGSTTTVTTNYGTSAQGLYIGIDQNGTTFPLAGYISNLRYIKGQSILGTATSFTVPTSPLTSTTVGWSGTGVASSITGTVSLLTCQSNRFVDNSTTPKTLTPNNGPLVVAFSPFNPTASWSAATNGGSGYFDGSGDYLSVADNANLRLGTSAFTIQAWVYRNASGTAHSIIAKGAASTGYVLQVTSTNVLRFTHGTTNVDTTTTIPASSWTHVAAVRTNTATNGFQLYINGVSSATATVSTDFNQTDSLYIGGDRSAANVMNGYISGLKYTNGTAESISVPTEPPTATTNVALLTNYTNAGIYDATSKNDLETVGNAQISTTQSKWGGSSMYFDGTGDYLKGNQATTDLYTFSGNFTIETWVYSTSSAIVGGGYPTIFATSAFNGTGIGLKIQSAGGSGTTGCACVWYNNTQILTGTSNIADSAWHHVAVTRSGSTIRLFVDGTQQTSATNSSTFTCASGYPLTAADSSSAGNLTGYIQDLRITRGYARYTANFTPPTAAFPTL